MTESWIEPPLQAELFTPKSYREFPAPLPTPKTASDPPVELEEIYTQPLIEKLADPIL